jgi:hypothetical protein
MYVKCIDLEQHRSQTAVLGNTCTGHVVPAKDISAYSSQPKCRPFAKEYLHLITSTNNVIITVKIIIYTECLS